MSDYFGPEDETYGERLERELLQEKVQNEYQEAYELLTEIPSSVTAEDYRDGWSKAVEYIDFLEQQNAMFRSKLWECILNRAAENRKARENK